MAAEVKKYDDPSGYWKQISAAMLAHPNRVRAYDTSICRNKWRRMKETGNPLVGQLQEDNNDDKSGEKENEALAATPGRGLNHSFGGIWVGYNGLSVDAARPPAGMTHDEAAAITRPGAGEQVWVPAGHDYIASAGGGEGEDDEITVVGTDGEGDDDDEDDDEIVVIPAGEGEDASESPDTIAQSAEVSGEATEAENIEAQGGEQHSDQVVGAAVGEKEETIIEDRVVPFGGGAQVEDVPLSPLSSAQTANAVEKEDDERVGASYADGNGLDEFLLARTASAVIARAAAGEGITPEQWEVYLQDLELAPPGYTVDRDDSLSCKFAWDRYYDYRGY